MQTPWMNYYDSVHNNNNNNYYYYYYYANYFTNSSQNCLVSRYLMILEFQKL